MRFSPMSDHPSVLAIVLIMLATLVLAALWLWFGGRTRSKNR